MAETKNVFISHVHSDDHGLQKLKNLLAPKGMDVRDSSIHVGKFNNASDPNYIKTQILAPAINWQALSFVMCRRRRSIVSGSTGKSSMQPNKANGLSACGSTARRSAIFPPRYRSMPTPWSAGTVMPLSTRLMARTAGKSLMVAPARQCPSSAIPANGPHLLLRGAL